PMLQVIAEGVPAREAEEQEAGRLVRWYRRLLQGKAPAAVGRPRGSSTYKDRNEFVVAVREAVLALRNQRRSITQRTVAEALNCDERQLREWTKQHEFDGWHDLRKAVDPQ
ncbi:MAG: hypothetical protein ACR2PL_21185, partial [Dehalococcoidia bacterium]